MIGHIVNYTFTRTNEKLTGIARSPTQATRLLRTLLPRDGREHFVLIFLNSNLDVLGFHEVAIGQLDRVLLSPREVFGAALRVVGCASVIFGHNHPSGNPQPSRSDLRLTRRLAKAGALLDVPLSDHIILGDTARPPLAYVSLAAQGVIT